MKQKAFTTILSLVLCMSLLLSMTGCGDGEKQGGYQKNPELDTKTEVTLRMVSSENTWPELDSVIAKFEEVYPNCTIVYEPIEEYSNNLDLRLSQDERKIDIFRTSNILKDTKYRDKALNLISEESAKILDLSGTNPGLVSNFRDTVEENTQYAIPFGGEMRGMYVNTTLLSKYDLEVPTNREELLHCCEVLYAAGLVPFQCDAGSFAQQLLYPYICNSVVNGGNYEQTYRALENLEPGISEYFRDAYTFLYDIVEKGYYDYKRVQDETPFTFNGNEGKAKDFLNVVEVSEGVYEKRDDVGSIAFMTSTQAFGLELAKTKSDYHSEIEYEFILSPVGADGGYAYLSPADGLAINNNSEHIDWALEFLNFFFTPEINKQFALEAGKKPNTTDALLQYNVPAERISDVGQMTFSYPFYKTVTSLMCSGYVNSYAKADFTEEFLAQHQPTAETADKDEIKFDKADGPDDMIGISKMTAPKYMTDNGDGTFSVRYSLEDYLARLEAEFVKIRESR